MNITLRFVLMAFLCLRVCVCFSGLAGPAEVALQHQPAAAEPPSADEGGRRRGRQGQRAEGIPVVFLF